MDAPKADFYWAVVGDAKPEPVAVVTENGKRLAYTCGCADPFDLDGPETKIVLIPESGASFTQPRPLTVPPAPIERAALAKARELRLELDAKRGIKHGHRRFNP